MSQIRQQKTLWQSQGHKVQEHNGIAHLQPIYLPTNNFHDYLFRYSPDKILKVKVTVTRLMIKSWSHQDIANLHPNQYPYQVSTSYSLWFPRNRMDKNVRLPAQPCSMFSPSFLLTQNFKIN